VPRGERPARGFAWARGSAATATCTRFPRTRSPLAGRNGSERRQSGVRARIETITARLDRGQPGPPGFYHCNVSFSTRTLAMGGAGYSGSNSRTRGFPPFEKEKHICGSDPDRSTAAGRFCPRTDCCSRRPPWPADLPARLSGTRAKGPERTRPKGGQRSKGLPSAGLPVSNRSRRANRRGRAKGPRRSVSAKGTYKEGLKVPQSEPRNKVQAGRQPLFRPERLWCSEGKGRSGRGSAAQNGRPGQQRGRRAWTNRRPFTARNFKGNVLPSS